MIIYSVTISLSPKIEKDWKEWMLSVHIPDIMNSGYFVEKRMTKVIDGHEVGVINYNIQYMCESSEKLNEYSEKMAPILQKKHGDRYGENFIAFRTVLEVIE